jgi:O-methyltransferase
VADQSTRNTSPARDRVYPAGYGRVEPVANYRPWDIDPEFQALYGEIRDNTMVDIYRLWILWVLARRAANPWARAVPPAGTAPPDASAVPPAGPGAVLEVGSWRGGSGAVLARAARPRPAAGTSDETADHPAPRVYLADTFAGVVKAGERDSYYQGGEHNNTSPELVRGFLDGLDLKWVELLVGIFPDDTGPALEHEHFSLCHIDVDVYQSARETFDWVWPRMLPGGVVVFDDYGFYGCEGVTACVDEIMLAFPSTPVIPNLSGQAIIVKTNG